VSEENVSAVPVAGADRLENLDVLRGFAVLGILAMNVQSFSMVGSAYLNPTNWGDLTGLNFVVWGAGALLADLKFMSLFSIMFGAGVVLFAERLEARGRKPAGLHYRRMWWLWLIGMLHAYFLWYGDVLVAYAVCGLLAFLWRKRSPRTLLIAGTVILMVPSVFYLFTGLTMASIPEAQVAGMLEWWRPDVEALAHETACYRGGPVAQFSFRWEETLAMQTMVFLINTGWRAGGLMLIGMALYKLGVLGGLRSAAAYRRLATVGLVVGLPLVGWGIVHNLRDGWTLAGSMYLGWQYNYWGSLGVALGYIGLVGLVVRTGALPALRARLAAAGRMAFTNYLTQTLLCITIFYGHGLGLFGRVDRWQQALLVLAVWALQLWWSPLWLARFRFGPFEWAWRSLTYWQVQLMRRGVR